VGKEGCGISVWSKSGVGTEIIALDKLLLMCYNIFIHPLKGAGTGVDLSDIAKFHRRAH
jgi:hypothetical protein